MKVFYSCLLVVSPILEVSSAESDRSLYVDVIFSLHVKTRYLLDLIMKPDCVADEDINTTLATLLNPESVSKV